MDGLKSTIIVLFVMALPALAEGAVSRAARTRPSGSSRPKPAAAPKIVPVKEPAAEAQEAAEGAIRELFAEEYAKRNAEDRKALAKRLIQEGVATKDDAAARFVCFREARDVAAGAGDAATAMGAVEQLLKYFVTDGIEHRLKLVTAATPNTNTPGAADALVRAGLDLLDAAILADEYDRVAKALPMMEQAASRTRDAGLVAHVKERTRDFAAMRVEFDRMNQAQEKLKLAANDPEANLAVGRFLCFRKGDWEGGMPYLLKSSDTAAKAVIQRDQAKPSKPSEKVALGDAWWDLASKQATGYRPRILGRAAMYYEEALSGVAGLTAERARQRIAAYEKMISPPLARIDLMALIDLGADTVAGDWSFTAKGLVCEGRVQSIVQIPFEPPEEYDFAVSFIRYHGAQDIVQILPKPGGGSFAWKMSVDSNTAFGFSMVDGRDAWNNRTTAKFRTASLINGQAHTSVVKVRKKGVEAYVDGRLVAAMKTDWSDVSDDPWYKTKTEGLPGLGSWNTEVIFQAAEILEVSGKGKRQR